MTVADQDPGRITRDAVLGVTVDLDDTLYPQADWLEGAWTAVADRGAALGIDGSALREALVRVAAGGSDRGAIIDRALAEIGVRDSPPVDELVRTFTGHRPDLLSLYPGVAEALALLRSRVEVVCVTDGNPWIQRGKIAALGLGNLLDHVVVSDELGGRAVRKPHPLPFRRALALLGLPPEQVVHIGDRPGKDVEGAAAVGMRCVRVRTGEYAAAPDPAPAAWRIVETFAAAVAQCRPHLVDAREHRSPLARL